MDQNQVIDVLRQGVWVTLKIGSPMLVLSMLIGIVVAIFQAATQIHEQSLTFLPKLLLIVACLLIGGNWMLMNLQEYTRMIFSLMI